MNSHFSVCASDPGALLVFKCAEKEPFLNSLQLHQIVCQTIIHAAELLCFQLKNTSAAVLIGWKCPLICSLRVELEKSSQIRLCPSAH